MKFWRVHYCDRVCMDSFPSQDRSFVIYRRDYDTLHKFTNKSRILRLSYGGVPIATVIKLYDLK